MQNLKKMLKDESGSVLVGVIALTVIMAISAVTYASIVRNTVSNEVMAFDDARAYLVAEQGLLMATNWVGVENNWNDIMGHTVAGTDNVKKIDVPSIYDDFDCQAELGWKVEHGNGFVVVTSRAVEKTTTGRNNKLPYFKELAWEVTGSFNSSSGAYATFVNKFDNTAFSSGGNAAGLHQRTAFFGPTHTNTPILLSQKAFDVGYNPEDQGARFFGSVSTWGGWYGVTGNAVPSTYWHDFGPSTMNRNYSQGVMLSKGDAQASANSVTSNSTDSDKNKARTQLNKVFTQSFNPYANQIKLEFDARDKEGNPINKSNIQKVLLNGAVEGETYSNSETATSNTAFIRFGRTTSGGAYYQYSNASGVFPNRPGNSVTSGTTDNQAVFYDENVPLILYAGNNATTTTVNGRDVLTITQPFHVMIDGGSQLAGKVTVVTAPNYNISFNLYKGDILYEGLERGTNAGTTTGTSPTPSNLNFSTNINYAAQGSGFGDYFSILGYIKSGGNTTNANMYSSLMQEGGVEIGDRVVREHVFGFYSGGDVDLRLFAPDEKFANGTGIPSGTDNEVNIYKKSSTEKYGYTYQSSTRNTYNYAETPSNYNGQRSRTLTAQVFAIEKNGGIVKVPKGINKLGSFVHVIGSVVMDKWWNQSVGTGSSTAGAGIRTYHDKRLINFKSPSAPGLGYGEYNNQGDRLLYMRTYAANWKETNTPK